MERNGAGRKVRKDPIQQVLRILIDKHMNKVQLRDKARISSNSLAKLGKNEPVHMDVLMKIATALDCKEEDLFETSQ